MKGGFATPREPKGTMLNNVKISKQDARGLAESILHDIELDYFSLASIEKARLFDDRSSKTHSEGWYLVFGRGDGGYIPLNLTDYADSIYRKVTAEYAAPWSLESLQMYIDENGLQLLDWSNPLKITQTVDKNIALLDFSDIQLRIKQQLENEWSWIEGEITYYDPSQTVYHVALSYSLQPQNDHLDMAMLVPTWFVFYKLSVRLDDDGLRSDLLALNAVDGSVVSPIPLC